MLITQTSFRNMDVSPAVDAEMHRRAERLEATHPEIVSCRVLLEAPAAHHRHGTPFEARVEVGIPGDMVVAQARDVDAFVALRDVFKALSRSLTELAERQRGDVKRHDART